MINIFAALQLNEPLFVTMAATLRAMNSSSLAEYCAGTMATGLTFPSSEVMRFFSTGSLSRRRRSRSGPGGPHTIRSCVWFEPVMWTSATPGCSTRCFPTSPAPYTIRMKPRSMNGLKARSRWGPTHSFTGFILISGTRPSANSL